MTVDAWYADQGGEWRESDPETVRAIREAVGDDDSPSPLVVVREGTPEAEGRPVGEYDLPGDRALLVAPRRCPTPPRGWGWMAQLYGVRSRRSWGFGDLADLAALARWSAVELGADFVLVNPLHAVAPTLPQQESPYFPASRRFVSPLYLAVEELPELARLDPDGRADVLRLAAEARALDDADLVDRDAVWRCKSAALERLFAVRRDLPAGDGVAGWAAWAALAETYGPDWRAWPAAARTPDAPEARAARRGERAAFHAWLQACCAEQRAAAQRAAVDAGMAVGVVHDLAVGSDPGGADTWLDQDVYASGFTVGAPPDAFNRRGQDWRLPPWRPDALRRGGYAPFRDLVRATLRDAGGIRVDHAMGLWRLWWLPEGGSPADGAYVRYDAAALLGILAYECAQAGAIAVAEDLGTVEPGVPEALRDSGVLGSAVLWFDDDYAEQTFASVTTHDLPTAAGCWTDDSPADRDRVLRLLRDAGLPTETVEDRVVAMHAFVAAQPSLLAAVAVNDAVGDPRRPNLPGTTDEHPNWRTPLPVPLDDLPAHPLLRRVVDAVRTARSRGLAGR